MKKWYGSLTNRLMTDSLQKVPVVGMGATVLMHSDRKAVTIVSVSENGKSLEITRDNAKRIDNNGMCETQEYEYTQRPDGQRTTYTKRKNGSWVRKGEPMHGQGLLIGERDEYYDFSY